jgi:type I restriction enzyme S subunit
MRTVALGDYADVFNGKTPSKAEQRDTGHPVLKIRDVNDAGQFRRKYESFVDPDFVARFQNKSIKAGDTLILNAAHNADYVGSKTFFADSEVEGAIATGEWLIVRPHRSALDARFASHWLTSSTARREIRELVKGIHLYPKDVARLSIPLPPLEEQKRIAAILDQADELRRKRQRALDRLNQLGQAIFIEMFGEWDRPGSNIKTLQLGDHIDFLTSGSRGWAEYYSDAGALFLRIQNVKRDELDLSDVAYVQAPATAESNRTRVRPGDVLLSITADLGRTAAVPEGIGEAYINQHLAIIRAARFDPRFLSSALSSPSGQRLILKRNREGVKAGLNFDDVRSVAIPDVGAKRQQEYGGRANAVDELKKSTLVAVEEAEKLFASLQHRAFQGAL